MKDEHHIFTLDDLCSLLKMNKRKIRFYIQKGLLDRPEGSGKGAYYTYRHVEQLLAVNKWKDAGLSLERIQEIVSTSTTETDNDKATPPPRPKQAGAVEVWSHLHIADGISLQIEPQRARLTPEQVRHLCQAVMTAYRNLHSGEK